MSSRPSCASCRTPTRVRAPLHMWSRRRPVRRAPIAYRTPSKTCAAVLTAISPESTRRAIGIAGSSFSMRPRTRPRFERWRATFACRHALAHHSSPGGGPAVRSVACLAVRAARRSCGLRRLPALRGRRLPILRHHRIEVRQRRRHCARSQSPNGRQVVHVPGLLDAPGSAAGQPLWGLQLNTLAAAAVMSPYDSLQVRRGSYT